MKASPHRRPPLPMFLGLAVLTVMAHFLMAAVHAVALATLGIAIDQWGVFFLVLIAGVAPVIAAYWMLTDAPRGGAALMSASMIATGALLYLLHYVWDTPANVLYLQGSWMDVLADGTAYMLLVLEILGFGVGGVLTWRPERRLAPLPVELETTAATTP